MFGAYAFGQPYFADAPIGPLFIPQQAETLELLASLGVDLDLLASDPGIEIDLFGSEGDH